MMLKTANVLLLVIFQAVVGDNTTTTMVPPTSSKFHWYYCSLISVAVIGVVIGVIALWKNRHRICGKTKRIYV